MRLFFLGLPVAAGGLALWNWRAGRADLRGAVTLGAVVGGAFFARWLLTAHHVPDHRELEVFINALGQWVFNAVSAAVFYLAVEPIVRKRWPWRMVAWRRLLAGRARDPLVARDGLIGLAVGAACALLIVNLRAGPVWAPDLVTLQPAYDVAQAPASLLLAPVHTISIVALLYFFLVFLVHWACRSPWLGVAVVCAAILGLTRSWSSLKPVSEALTVVAIAGVLQLVALRYGLLAFVVGLTTLLSLQDAAWTFDVGAWFATGPNLYIAALLALTLYAAYTATEGRLFGMGSAGDD